MASAGLKRFEGFVAQGHLQHTCKLRTSASAPRAPRAPFRIVAQKSVRKMQQAILTADVPQLGAKGDLVSVVNGYFRNYLLPQRMAVPATPGILEQIQQKIKAAERAAAEEKAKAQAMATALATIGKFIIRKKVGEKDQIFGSVTTQEVVEAIEMQTGRVLDKKNVTLPDISTLGTYDAVVKLHPEVVGLFKIVVQKQKNA